MRRSIRSAGLRGNGRMRREIALHGGRQERGGRPLARHVAEREPELGVRKLEIVEEIAANRTARNARGGDVERPAGVAGLGQQALLNLGGDAQVALELGLLRRLRVQPRAVDGEGRLGRERLERGPGRLREQGAALAAVQIQHADGLRLGARPGRAPVRGDVQRHAEHVANADRNRAAVRVREAVVHQVRDDAAAPGLKHLARDLAARGKRRPRQRAAAAVPADVELQLAARRREHDEPALGGGDLQRRVEHERQHLFDHAPGPYGAQAVENGRHLLEIRQTRLGRPKRGAALLVEQEDQLDRVGLAEPYLVAVRERPFAGQGLAIQERAEPGPGVHDAVLSVLVHDARVVARHVAAGELQVRRRPAADREHRLLDDDGSRSLEVGNFQPGHGHHAGLAFTTPTWTSRPVKS